MQLRIEDIRRELCRKSFWDFCVYYAPDFYREDRTYLKDLCDTLQAFKEGRLLRKDGKPYRKLATSVPPRMGKSRTLELFEIWCFGIDVSEKVMTISYNETLSIEFSKSVRDKIQTPPSPSMRTVSDIFPQLRLKHGSASSHLWALDGQHQSYLGGSPSSTLTGIGATICVIDDLIKNAIEALNERILEEHYQFYTNTLRQRLEENHIIIVNFTRWATNDLIGRLVREKPDEWYVMTMEAKNITTGEMLCSELLSAESYDDIKRGMLDGIFMANYHQRPMDIEGRLYKSIKTYKDRPVGVVRNYTDTADEGNCYLCSIDYVLYKQEAYVINVLYTGAGMEVTEGQTAKMLYEDGCNQALIESNNGGKGFARAVDRILKTDYKSNTTVIKWFHQSQNKTARILSQSAWVQEHIYFPEDWHLRWSEFYRDVTTYVKGGRGQKEDAPDVLTGIAETISKKGIYMF